MSTKPKVTPKPVDPIAALKAQNAELSNQIDKLTIDQMAVFRTLAPGPEQTLKDLPLLAESRMSELAALQKQKGTK